SLQPPASSPQPPASSLQPPAISGAQPPAGAPFRARALTTCVRIVEQHVETLFRCWRQVTQDLVAPSCRGIHSLAKMLRVNSPVQSCKLLICNHYEGVNLLVLRS